MTLECEGYGRYVVQGVAAFEITAKGKAIPRSAERAWKSCFVREATPDSKPATLEWRSKLWIRRKERRGNDCKGRAESERGTARGRGSGDGERMAHVPKF